MHITVVGGGLAGSEAAWQIANAGIPVRLLEMRPQAMTEAHRTGDLAELVCSNSLRSDTPPAPSWILKRELDMAGSLIMDSAHRTKVPAGSSLAVDRLLFAKAVTERVASHALIEVVREEVERIPDGFCIVATGPLTSGPMVKGLAELVDESSLYFYDAIAPIVSADSIDFSKAFFGSRYDKGGDDYLNCPMSEEEYERFFHALLGADRLSPRPFESVRVFEGCMPIEVMAERGQDTMRFGPLRPVGLVDPATGRMPYAVVQLRSEDRERTSFNMVGFQCRLRWQEQQRVFRMIPGLEAAEFLRFGSMHRNTFLNSPKVLNADLSLRSRADLFIAGQLTGVEGYLESTAMGLLAAIHAVRRVRGLPAVVVPEESAHGSLLRYVTSSESENFQPSNINLSLFPPIPGKVRDKRLRRSMVADRALSRWREYLTTSPLGSETRGSSEGRAAG